MPGHTRAAFHSLVSTFLTVPTVGLLTVCFLVVAPSVNKDVHVYLPCGFGIIEGWDNLEKKTDYTYTCLFNRESKNIFVCWCKYICPDEHEPAPEYLLVHWLVCSIDLITVTDPFIMQLHPDSDPSNPTLHSQFVELNEAYRVLSKDMSRKEYDFKIRHPYSGGQAFRSTSTHTSHRARWRYTLSVSLCLLVSRNLTFLHSL